VSAELQVERLMAIAAEYGWTIADVFTERQATVKKDQRPGEKALMDAIRAGGVDRVLLWSACRIGISLAEVAGFLEACRNGGIELYLHKRGIDTATSNGMALFDLGAMLAFHLRQTRRDRILRGQAAVKGIVRIGRPPIPATKAEKAKKALMTGKGVREAARLAGISAASVSRLIKKCAESGVGSNVTGSAP
jgi:DNA invertase Pin-like site-specific DNA recombinase